MPTKCSSSCSGLHQALCPHHASASVMLAVLGSQHISPYLTATLTVRLSCLNFSSDRMSQPRQARVEGHDSQRCSAVAYGKLNCGTTPPPGGRCRIVWRIFPCTSSQ